MISPEMVGYIRTMIKGDHQANDQLEAKLDAQGWDGFSILLGSVFFLAANHHFSSTPESGDVIRLVADIRAAAPAGLSDIDANAAEELILAALDPDRDSNVEPQMAGRIQGLVILHVLGNNAVSDAELDALLNEAAGLANRLAG